MRKRFIDNRARASRRTLLERLAMRSPAHRQRVGSLTGARNRLVPQINLPFPTFGGRQIWGDVFYHGGWRIQRNIYTAHYRLLDPRNFRRAWGTYDHCRDFFDRCRTRSPIQLRNGHMVMLVHGLGRSAGAFTEMEDALRRSGYETASVNYPSTRQGIQENADNLEKIVRSLDGVDTLSFVTHSLGALVVRDLMSRADAWQDDAQVHRIVMIAPPNQGSRLADRLKEVPAYQWLTGDSGQGLTSDAAMKLPVPEVEFGIIAGGRGNELGFNPLLSGDDDGFVAVSETRLDGAQDFLLVPTTHGLVDDHPQTIDATLNFLRDGRFLPEANPAHN